MLIPYGTDAPMQRPPIGTFVIAGLNVVLFFLQDWLVPESFYVLCHDGGLNPIQWGWSAFAHGNSCHLIGNMFFLLAFGMVIESTLKTWQFLVVYLVTAISQNAIEQSLAFCGVFTSSGGSLGASSAIYGLMMMGIFFAPGRNILTMWIFQLGYYVSIHRFEIPVAIMALWYFFIDFGIAMFSNFQMGTPWLHVSGAFVGLGVGLVVYAIGWCDSDGQDLLSLIRDTRFPESDSDKGPKPAKTNSKRNTNLKSLKKRRFGTLENLVPMFDRYLDNGRYELALNKLKQIHADHGRFQLSEKQLVKLINLSIRKNDGSNALKLIEQYLNEFKTHSDVFRLQKSRLLFVNFKSPVQAARALQRVNVKRLNERQSKLFRQLKAKINDAIPSQTGRWRKND